MDGTYWQELYDYDFWAHRRVWDCVMPLSDEQFNRDLGNGIRSIRQQCVHVMGTEAWWFRFLQTGEIAFLDLDDYPTRASIRAQWDEVEQSIRRYLETVSSQELERDVHPDFWDEPGPIKVWQALVQVANHDTDHRAHLLASIHQLGGPTVGQDYLDYIFAKRA